MPVTGIGTWALPSEEGRAPAPRSVAIGPRDEVVVADNAGRILVYGSDGVLLRRWRTPENKDGNPEGTCWLRDGRIAVADTHYHRVLFYDPRGVLLGSLGKASPQGAELTRDAPPGTFVFPMSIVEDDAGFLYVSEYGGNDRIQKFGPDGRCVAVIGSPGHGPGQFQRAAGLAWRRGAQGEGLLYVADTENGRVQVFRDDGVFVEALDARESGGLALPYDVEALAGGDLLVAEWGAGRITRLDGRGRVVGRFGSAGTGEGQFRTPWGVAVDGRGRVRVADTENRRIVALEMRWGEAGAGSGVGLGSGKSR